MIEKKDHIIEVELPFEIGSVYLTKFQIPERFKITKIHYNHNKTKIIYFSGLYENNPNLGVCSLNFDRFKPLLKSSTIEINVCSSCKKPI